MALFRTESYKRGIVYSSAFNVSSRAIAFIQQWLIAFYFGTTAGTDIFFLTYSIELYISYFFLNMTTSVLVPEGIKIRNRESEQAGMAFMNTFMRIYAIASFLIFALFMFDTKQLFGILSEFSEKTIEENLTLIRLFTPLIFLNTIVSILSETMASYKFFTIPNMVSAINSQLSALFFVLFHNTLGLESVVVGLLIGAVFNLICLLWMMKKQLKWDFTTTAFSRIKSIFSSGMYTQIGFLAYIGTLFAPQYLFSTFSEGSLTAMNYAEKLSNIPCIFLITQVVNVMAIKFNNLVSANDSKSVSNTIFKLMLYFPAALFGVVIITMALSHWGVDFLFGMKFSKASIDLTANLLSLMILFLPFNFAYLIFLKVFNAYKKQNIVFWVQTITQCTVLVLYYFLIPKFGEMSFPVLKVIPYALSLFIILPILRKYCPEVSTIKLSIIFLLLIGLSAAAVGYFGFF